ncbi:ATP-dependent zinc metalloprotease FtsH [Apilactobacillus apinorum]|uniref:ATP-dependent zinc metalloprotease FtsH n=1 Tax=Apilactobacillus apinorum TaxID=1218495 RepID=A0ABP9ZI49_9LACO|nr:ATP-dependent zinc metalloprotease FtsH [Apilactobacillus apinorum]KOY69585.1 ATP-dependent zinc metalloprotease FtsH [Apilactobacillus apinorum]CAI2632296.1 ftsH ATP-dependent zinc metalloprotease FtsH [Apilactobacillus apinorum]
MRNNNKGLFKNSLFYIVCFLIVLGVTFFVTSKNGQPQTQDLQSSQFVQELKDNKIKSFSIQPEDGVYTVTGEYRKAQSVKSDSNSSILFTGAKSETKVSSFKTKVLKNNSTINEITEYAKKNGVKMGAKGADTDGGFWSNLIFSLLPMLIIIVFFFIMMNQMGGKNGSKGGIMGVGKSKAKPTKSDVRFSDVAGEEEEKQELVEVVEFLKDPKKFTKLGAKIPHGVLLEGPPGTGKTLLAKAVSGEAGVPFYSISGSDFVEMFVGVGASRVRDLFEQAKKDSPAIIFIDEIDAVGRKRGNGMGGGHDEREQTLNQLLVEMDGFSGNDGVIVIAATNRADVLDPALTRPGRFDRKVLVSYPDVKGREAILKVHAKNKPIADNVDLHAIAQQTPGFVGADLANLLNEAALLAARRNKSEIGPAELDEAEDRVIAGPAKKDKAVSKRERNIVANHEAGHAIVGLVLNDARVVHKVTIVPRGRAGGYAIMLPKEDQYFLSKKNAMEQLAGLMGGRTAEEIVFDSLDSGASNDFEQATNLARSMVTQYGMSEKLGTVQLVNPSDDPYARRYSEKTAAIIDEEIKRIIDEAHGQAHDIIAQHREQHKAIADALLEYETLDEKQILSLYRTGKMPEEEETNEDSSFEESKEKLEQKENQHQENNDED